ncbi:MAG: patatin family protein [Bacteroidetes bacterium]|nr:patatin family protein [Bacteroidota bacterium]MDA0903482.1 patatin family protein [Bacteroidota bacterium]MDA1241933.1 patatin family protein [Bacteroidota bacterium]
MQHPHFDTLILEGGSLRCSFTAGVMDALVLLGPLSFERTIGVSAGAMVMASHLAGQYKHFYRVAKELVDDGKFISFRSAWSKEGLMNLAHLKAHVMRHAPLNLDALERAQSRTHALVVTTHYESGEALYIEPRGREWIGALIASATLPMVTRGKVQFRGEWMFDGGYADSLPLDKAIELGARSMLVVRTRPIGDHVVKSTMDSLASYWYKDQAHLTHLFNHGHERYNATVDRLLLGGDDQGRTWEEIAPPFPLRTSGWSVGSEEVMLDYRLGAETAMNWWALKMGHVQHF